MAETPILFDKTDAVAIYEYSHKLINHSLHELFGEEAVVKSRKGKGRLGQMVEELFFRYDVNSDPSADFEEASLELKCTPLLRYKGSEEYRIKERLVCTMIDYFEVARTTFEDSHLLRKCRLMLLLFYLHVKGVPAVDYKFVFRVLWELPAKDLLIIKNDYRIISEKVRRGEAHLLSEGDTMYLGACRKGQKGDLPQAQPNSHLKAHRRAFSLKPAYMRNILKEVTDGGGDCFSNYHSRGDGALSLVSCDDLEKKSFEDIITERFIPYVGKDYEEICSMLGHRPYKSKSKYADIAGLIASGNVSKRISKSEEFVKSGIVLKTVRVNAKGTPEECMSFKNIDYEEVADNGEWPDSELYELFTGRFMFVVFKKSPGHSIEVIDRENGEINTEDAYVFDRVMFWTMPPDDLETAEEYWRHIRHNVLSDRISLDSFWKIGDNRKFHVRPKGTKRSYLMAATNPNGGMADKFSYWFNAQYVKEIIGKR